MRSTSEDGGGLSYQIIRSLTDNQSNWGQGPWSEVSEVDAGPPKVSALGVSV